MQVHAYAHSNREKIENNLIYFILLDEKNKKNL